MYIVIALIALIVVYIIWRRAMDSKLFINISASELETMIKDKEYQLVDVREVSEYKSGHIKSAINIPLRTIQKNLSRLKKDKKIVVICASGSRSKAAARQLAVAGYQVYNLQRGMSSWQGAVKK